MTFEQYWQRKIQANQQLANESMTLRMKISAFKKLLENAYNIGAKDTALVAKELEAVSRPRKPSPEMPEFMRNFFDGVHNP